MSTALGVRTLYSSSITFFYNTEQVQLAYIARNSKMHYCVLLKNTCLCIIVDKKMANLVNSKWSQTAAKVLRSRENQVEN